MTYKITMDCDRCGDSSDIHDISPGFSFSKLEVWKGSHFIDGYKLCSKCTEALVKNIKEYNSEEESQ